MLNRILGILFFLFVGTAAVAAESSFTHCQFRNVLAENFESINSPASTQVSNETGIQILTLKKNVLYSGLRYDLVLQPVSNTQVKVAMANRVAMFLNSFPKSFLADHSEICFLIIEDRNEFEGMTNRHVVVLPTDASLEALAHEFMHAIDDLEDDRIYYEAWDHVNEGGNCNYDRNVNFHKAFQAESIDANCFVTPYAKFDIYEDRAELFSALYRNHGQIRSASGGKNAIAGKAYEIKLFLWNISGGVLNDNFWNSLP